MGNRLRRRKLPPDTRPKWDDPLETFHHPTLGVMSLDLLQRIAARRYDYQGRPKIEEKYPNWHQDPSYNWRNRLSRRP